MILRVMLTQHKGLTPNPEKRDSLHRRSKVNRSGDPRTPTQMHQLLFLSNSKRNRRLSKSKIKLTMQPSQKVITQEGLKPRKKKSNEEKMTLVRVEPVGLPTRNSK